MNIMDLLKALRFGEELSDPAKWKKGHISISAITGILLLVLKFIGHDMPEDSVVTIAEAIAGILVVINLFLVPATSKKIGM